MIFVYFKKFYYIVKFFIFYYFVLFVLENKNVFYC